jgi:hypothetical protein
VGQLTTFNCSNTLAEKNHTFKESPTVYGIPRLEFWFKPEVISALVKVREYGQNISDPDIRLFFQIAFSETVRESSNTRNEEFKLYRYADEKLAKFKPNVLELMATKLERNLNGYKQYLNNFKDIQPLPSAIIHSFNTVLGIPEQHIPNESIDIVVTSPPYGDSSTTVAYGQYSRLSAAWLELDEPDKIDAKLMGSKSAKQISTFPSKLLNQAISQIALADEKRAREVSAFYDDLLASIQHVAKTIRKGGHACYVVGNRKVKGVVLPTDVAVKDFFEAYGYTHIETFIRSIPNKRMPAQNSPSNTSGVLDNTMTKEYIVVLKRQ